MTLCCKQYYTVIIGIYNFLIYHMQFANIRKTFYETKNVFEYRKIRQFVFELTEKHWI